MNITGYIHSIVTRNSNGEDLMVLTGSQGAFSSEFHPDNSYSSHTYIQRSGGTNNRTLLRFDASKTWTGETILL